MSTISEGALANMILRVGFRYVGLVEVKPNQTWDDPSTPGPDTDLSNQLRALMSPAPWQPGWAYCAAFVEGVVTEALKLLGATPEQIKKFSAVMTAHCMTSYRAFVKLGLISNQPSLGSIWIAQNGTSDQGHAGFSVAGAGTPTMATLEANTSAAAGSSAKEREGDWITARIRRIMSNGNLYTKGFVSPASILKLIYS